jgi:hypothetical protein
MFEVQQSKHYSTGAAADGYSFVTGTTAPGAGCFFLGAVIENHTGSTLYAQLYDGYAAANITGAPIAELQISANSQQDWDFRGVNGVHMNMGIMIAASSTQWSFTPVASAMFVTAWYV